MDTKTETYSVLVLDMAHSHDEDGEHVVKGFASEHAAQAYAEARVRSSVEELRGENASPEEIRSQWHLYGEDCVVIGGGYRGSANLDLYIAVPASPEELGWAAMTPRLKRFHVVLLVSDTAGESVWSGGFINRYVKPDRDTLLTLFGSDIRQAFARTGHMPVEPWSVTTAHNFELFDSPEPPIGKAWRNWRVDVEFVCHDVKFGSSSSGVFLWPDKPEGWVLDAMSRVLVGDMLAIRGDGPDYANYSDVLKLTVTETQDEPDYPASPKETLPQ